LQHGKFKIATKALVKFRRRPYNQTIAMTLQHFRNLIRCRAQSVECETTDWTTRVRSPTGVQDSSSNLCVQTGSEVHPASCIMGTGGSFPGGKARPGRDADHPPLPITEVKNEQELYLLSAQTPPWCVAGQLYFTSWSHGVLHPQQEQYTKWTLDYSNPVAN
jgi:hypothetical protein